MSCCFAAACSLALGQTEKPRFKVEVDLLSLDVEVLDRQGKAIPGLEQKDFLVKENGAVVEITHFARLTDVPVSLVIVINTSFMSQAKLSVSKRAVFQLIHLLKPDDEICLYTLDRRDAYLEQSFGSDRARLIEALDNVGVPSGSRRRTRLQGLFGSPPQTGLGVDLGLAAAEKARHGKHALLLITDRIQGLGTGALQHLQETTCAFLQLGFSGTTDNRLALAGAAAGDGELMPQTPESQAPEDGGNVAEACRVIAHLLKSHYSLGYQTRFPGDIGARRIEVLAPGRDYRIYARRSYSPSR